jgi:VanZ family protein
MDRRLLLAAWCAAWLVIAAGSLIPSRHLPTYPPDWLSDVQVHATAYMLMVATAALFCRRVREVALVALVALAIGAGLEYAQAFVPERGARLADLLANLLGAAIGFSVAASWILLGRTAPGGPG